MKKITLLGMLLIPFLLVAQIPSYYNDVNLTLTGISLKNELATKIINTHTRFLSYSEIWSSSKITDLDPNDATQSNVILLYGYNDNDGNYVTDRTRSKNANGGNNGTDWNREHTYAKSLGSPNLGTSGPGSDAHHLRPADVSFNGQRSSKRFATGSGNAGDSNGGWYPGDEWKGDVARMMMYMYLRYGNQCKPTGVGMGSSSSTPDLMIDLFLQWNAQDPVSQIEKNRNAYHGNSSNTYAQGNRNPFIDNPAFATQIWGGPQAEDLFGGGGSGSDTQAPTAPSSLTASNTTQTTTLLSWGASSDNVGVTGYNVYKNGSFQTSTTSTTYNVTGLTAATSYSFTVKAKDAAGNISSASNTASITTQSGGGGTGGSELFFSEYIEGSSYNKAIEIVNVTGSAVNLSSYKIKKQSNGSGGWSSGMSLSGQLANGDVFVAANSNASSTITSVADVTNLSTEMSFNGNDAIGLFKNNVLIDIIGTFNGGSANFAKDQTLRRKASVGSPSTTFDKAGEWDTFAKNTFNGLGSHTFSGGGNQDTQAPTAPSNVTAANTTQTTTDLTWNSSSDNVGVTGYRVYKNGTFLATTGATSYHVTGLTATTTYSFTVKAKDAANNISSTSNTATITTSGNSTTTDILLDHSFETGWNGWADGGGDCYRIKSSRSYDGRYSIRIRDNSGTASAMTSSSYNVTAYDNLEVTFNFYSYSMEYNEDFWLRYYDGSTWRTVKRFVRGTDFNNNRFTAATVNISSSSYNFPSNARFRFQCDASSNADQIYIDNVVVTATSGVKSAHVDLITLGKEEVFEDENLIETEDTKLYPNPAVSSHTVLRTEIDIEDDKVDVQIMVRNMQGRTVKTIQLENVQDEFFEQAIDLSNLKSGLYFVTLTTSKGFHETKKLVVK